MDEHDCENTFQPQQLCTGDGDDMLMATRKMILTKGLPSFDDISDQRVRREVWKLLLGVGDEMHVNDYIDLVKVGAFADLRSSLPKRAVKFYTTLTFREGKVLSTTKLETTASERSKV